MASSSTANAEDLPQDQPDASTIARSIHVAIQACEAAQGRGAFKLEEVTHIASAVDILKKLIKPPDAPETEEGAEGKKEGAEAKEQVPEPETDVKGKAPEEPPTPAPAPAPAPAPSTQRRSARGGSSRKK